MNLIFRKARAQNSYEVFLLTKDKLIYAYSQTMLLREMAGACRTHEEVRNTFPPPPGNPRWKGSLRYLGLEWRIIFNCIVEK
jgi:hypothetical protein